jgi:glycosyltransferase involved in cell wall biosynthesis
MEARKLLGSLASGVPVVTTTIGNEGLDLIPGEEALIADDPQGLARHVVTLYQDPGLLDQLAERGRQVVAHRYSESVARATLAQVFRDAR